MLIPVSLSLASVIAAVVAWLILSLRLIPPGVIDAIEHFLTALSRRRVLLFVLIPAASFLISGLIAVKNGIPKARIQDEFSYLLAADTFSLGRMTNPTPRCWEHFETPHELMVPSYMSKYPPGQAISLAIGTRLTGLPIVGVWLTTAAACTAIYWMLLGFTSPTWALVGASICLIHPLLLDWSQKYWGGSVAVLAGALVLGAWARLMVRPLAGQAAMLALGLVILANSRPYEGLVFAAALMLVLIAQMFRRGFSGDLLKAAAAMLSVLLPAAVLMCCYNDRVTGHPLRMPFMEYSRQYDVYPKFFFLPKNPPPVYRNLSMQTIHTVYERGAYDLLRTPTGFLTVSWQKLVKLVTMHADPVVLLLPLLISLGMLHEQKLRWVWLAIVVLLMGVWVENFFIDHYAAPVFAAMVLMIVTGWRWMYRRSASSQSLGKMLARAVMIGVVTSALVNIGAPISAGSDRMEQQALIAQSPALQAGRHLIFVRYGPGHLMHDEWVYNQADLPNSRIIWARYMKPAADKPVADFYSRRHTWLLTVGERDLRLVPYQP